MKGKISNPMLKSIELLLENHNLREERKRDNTLFNDTIKKILQDN